MDGPSRWGAERSPLRSLVASRNDLGRFKRLVKTRPPATSGRKGIQGQGGVRPGAPTNRTVRAANARSSTNQPTDCGEDPKKRR